MKITRSINEGRRVEFDKQGFEQAAYSFIKRVIKKLPFAVNLDSITINNIEKTKSPITFNVSTSIIVSGNNIVAENPHDQTGNQISIYYKFYRLPGNTKITENTLKDLPYYNHTAEEDIIQDILRRISTSDMVENRKSLYRSKEEEIRNKLQQLENKYSVKLNIELYPDENRYSKETDEYYSINVNVLMIEGSLGKFIQPPGDYYEYIINNTSYSTFLRYKDNTIVRHYSGYRIAEISMEDLYQKTEQELIDLIERVKLLDFIVANEQNIVDKFKLYVKNLQNKYPMLSIVVTRSGGYWDPDPLKVTVASTSDSWDMTFDLEELFDDSRMKQAITKIQRKLYKTDKSNSSLKSNVKSFIEENIDLLTQDLDEFYDKAKKKRIDLVVLTKVLLQADIPIKYQLTNVPDEIKDMI